ncbi:MAG: hypothetical protein NDI94_07130, partial [Candidatus Woesearchaeota archaeon]|nr:hypothetical protein [Candidatus Woesearchaeota archaeon]
MVYFAASYPNTTGFFDYIYSSFAYGTGAAGTRGIFSFANLTFSLILMSLITAKIVSARQDALLEKIYDISISEKTSRISNILDDVKREAERTLPALESCEVVNRKMIYEIKGTVSKFKACMNDICEIDIKNFEKQQLEMLASGIYSNLELMNKMQEIMHSKDLVFKNASLLEEVYAIVLSAG